MAYPEGDGVEVTTHSSSLLSAESTWSKVKTAKHKVSMPVPVVN
jgi:hypothetical protein